jgi:Arc/MetJ-type ribon-helix-helix transcriptional regulator
MEDMASRTTVVLSDEEVRILREASKREGVSQSELIRRGIRLATATSGTRKRPTVAWLRLSEDERAAIAADDFGDFDRDR